MPILGCVETGRHPSGDAHKPVRRGDHPERNGDLLPTAAGVALARYLRSLAAIGRWMGGEKVLSRYLEPPRNPREGLGPHVRNTPLIHPSAWQRSS